MRSSEKESRTEMETGYKERGYTKQERERGR